MSCMRCHHAHIPSHSPTPSYMPMPSVTIVTGSTNDTNVLSPHRLTSTQCKCQWATNPESIPTPITQLEVYVITITVCIIFGQQSFSDYTAGFLHPYRTLGSRRGCFAPRTKKLIFSADFSVKNWFSVVLEKIFGWKNRLQKIGKKSRKIADFSAKNRKNPIFSRKNPIFPEIWGKLYFRSLRGEKLKKWGQTKLQN